MACDITPSSQVLDLLFDENNGVLSKELEFDEKGFVGTVDFTDLDLLSDNFSDELFSFLQQSPEEDYTQTTTTDSSPKHKVHSDHDYFAQRSPGQHSDSGVSVNSADQEDSCLTSMSVPDINGDSVLGQKTSPYRSDSMSPYSDSNSDSNPLGLEDFDFSSCMDLDHVDGMDFSTVDDSCLSDSPQDTNISIDFEGSQQHVQTIKTANGKQAVILVDAATRQPVQMHRVTSRSSNSDSLPYTMKDVSKDFLTSSYDAGMFPELRLTDEEKELLSREGVALPTNMPLTKEEERVLKGVRRKIRNKISAKESRKRKQGYVEGLERRVKMCTQENQKLTKQLESLEKKNTTLLDQLKAMQTMLTNKTRGPAQASTCVVVLLLSFALLVMPNISLFGKDLKSALTSDTGMKGNSRSLLGKDEQQTTKVSLFSEAELQDKDPYGVSTKPEMPWEPKTPIPSFSTKEEEIIDVVGIDDEEEKLSESKVLLKQARMEELQKKALPASGKESLALKTGSNDTGDPQDPNSRVETEVEDAEGDDRLLFESEIDDSDHNYHQPPPAKKLRKGTDL